MPSPADPSLPDTLRARERRLRALEEDAAGHAIVTIGPDGLIADWSGGARILLGWSGEDVIGRAAAMLFTPEDRAAEVPGKALRKVRAEGRLPEERWFMRKDGSRCRMAGEMIALRDEGGAFAGCLMVLHDRAERHPGVALDVTGKRWPESRMRIDGDYLRRLTDALPVLIAYVDREQRYRFNNKYYEDWFGRSRDEVTGRHVRDILGEEAYAVREAAIRAALAGEHVVFDAFIPHREDGRREVEMQYIPRRGADGTVDGFFVIAFDVTARKRSEEHLRLLNDELNHRVKNLLATVQSIAWQTLRDAETLPHAREAFTSRLMVMAKAHDLLTLRNWAGAGLAEVVSLTVQTYQDANRRFRAEGPDIRLSSKTALSVSMALHELATNAVKYGALSNEEGRVDISWRIVEEAGGRGLRLRWRESGGPPVSAPERTGFGSRLIERGLSAELGGSAVIVYDPSGLVCTVEAPLARL